MQPCILCVQYPFPQILPPFGKIRTPFGKIRTPFEKILPLFFCPKPWDFSSVSSLTQSDIRMPEKMRCLVQGLSPSVLPATIWKSATCSLQVQGCRVSKFHNDVTNGARFHLTLSTFSVENLAVRKIMRIFAR